MLVGVSSLRGMARDSDSDDNVEVKKNELLNFLKGSLGYNKENKTPK